MASLFDIGKSAVQSYRQALSVTGQNIANINTDGYKRREASLEEVSGSQGGITSLSNQSGLGVRVSDIRRSFDEYLLDRTRTTGSQFSQMDSYVKELKRLENTLLPTEGDLGSQIGSFFESLQEIAASPADLAPRTVAIEKGRAMADSFQNLAMELESQRKSAQERAEQAIAAINIFSEQLSEVNSKILAAGQSGQSPNSIFDLRDKTLADMSELMDISVKYTGRGVANVSVGGSGIGPTIVESFNYVKMGLPERNGVLQPTINTGTSNLSTNQVSAGLLAGLINSHGKIGDVIKDLNQLALVLSQEINAQHKLGVTLDGIPGREMFSNASISAANGVANRGSVATEIEIIDALALPKNDMTAVYNEENENWTLSGLDFSTPITGNSLIKTESFSIQFSGQPKNGDVVNISALPETASGLKFLLSRAEEFAAASPLLVSQDTSNSSEAKLEVLPEAKADNNIAVPQSIEKVLNNADAPILAQSFFSDGVVAAIPAGTPAVQLSSYPTQASISFSVTDAQLVSLTNLSFKHGSAGSETTYSINLTYGSIFSGAAAGETWKDASEIANLLNIGTIKTSANATLKSLGMYASGKNGNLTIAAKENAFLNPTLTAGTSTIGGNVTSPVNASDLHIFTREGRHIAGVPLTEDSITELLTEANGFNAQAQYRGDYLNQKEPGYRDMNLNMSLTGGEYSLTTGANGTSANFLTGVDYFPFSATSTYDFNIALPTGGTHTIEIPEGSSAGFSAETINTEMSKLGISAEAITAVSLGDFTSTGTVSFEIEGKNDEPISISASVGPTTLSNLVAAINRESNDTGITATLAIDARRLILHSNDGDDILISSVISTGPSFTSTLISEDGSEISSPTILGTDLGQKNSYVGSALGGLPADGSVVDLTFNGKRYTLTMSNGEVVVGSPSGFTYDNALKAFFDSSNRLRVFTTNNTQDQSISVTADSTVSDNNTAANLFGLDNTTQQIMGNRIDAVGEARTLNIDVGGNAVTVSIDSSGNITESPDYVNVNASWDDTSSEMRRLIISAINGAGSIKVIEGADEKSLGYGVVSDARFSGQIKLKAASSFSLTANSVTTSASQDANSGGHVKVEGSLTGETKNISYLVNKSADTAAESVDGLKAIAPAGSYSLTLPAVGTGPSFTSTVSSEDFDDLSATAVAKKLVDNIRDQAVQTSLSGGTALSSIPEDGSSVKIKFDDTMYTLTMVDGEVEISGGDESRITAYFDASKRLQIFAGGSLAAKRIEVPGDSEVTGNVDSATSFGVNTSTNRVVGNAITATGTARVMTVSLNGTSIEVSIDTSGNITENPNSSDLTVAWDSTATATRRLVLSASSSLGDITYLSGNDEKDLGFKITDTVLRRKGEEITYYGLSGQKVNVSATASSLANQTVTMSNLPTEDFIVVMTGSGARSVSAVYDKPVSNNIQDELLVEVMNDSGTLLEIFDKDTGHSIATRVIDDNGKTEALGMGITLNGKGEKNDKFVIAENTDGTGDARNLDRILELQNSDVNGQYSEGFQKIFSTLVSGVGASVQSGDLSLEALSANRDAAMEAEASFSGVNLDTEAAALLEFQQAYQASARILQTARELFRTLIDTI